MATTTPGWTMMGSGAGGFKFSEFTEDLLPEEGPRPTLGSIEACLESDGDFIANTVDVKFGLSKRSNAMSYIKRYTIVAYESVGKMSGFNLEV